MADAKKPEHSWSREDRKAAVVVATLVKDVAFRHAISPTAFAAQVNEIVGAMVEGRKCTADARELIDELKDL